MADIDDALERLSLATETPRRIVMVHPITAEPIVDDEGKEGWIDLYSADSELARSHDREITRRRFNRVQPGRPLKLTPEELEVARYDLWATLTSDWHLLDLKGKKIEVACSRENARRIYEKVPWIGQLVENAVSDRGNFAPALSVS